MSISVKSRKAKGRRFQQWICKKISDTIHIDWGKDKDIESREMGQSGTDVKLYGDAAYMFPFSIESKNAERWSIPTWIKQAKANRKKNTNWLLFCKSNHVDPIVIIDAEEFFKLYEYVEPSYMVNIKERRE